MFSICLIISYELCGAFSSAADAEMTALLRQLTQGLHRLAIQPANLRLIHGKQN